MSSTKQLKAGCTWRVHAFDTLWDPVPGWPVDYKDVDLVYDLLVKLSWVRYEQLVNGVESRRFQELNPISVVEIEVYYE